jgi:bacillithiol synthase
LNKLVAPTKALGYSQLYLDYLAGKLSARQFFLSGNFDEIATATEARDYHRTQLIAILRRQNTVYGASGAALTALEQLADPRAVCVMAGQQAGLFGGSLLVQIKALALVKKAAQLAERLKRPVVPIFWIAGDDHDFAEVAGTSLLNHEGAIAPIKYAAHREVELPVGETKFDDAAALQAAVSEYHAALGTSDFTPDLYDLLDRAYTPNDTFVTAFGKLMAKLTEPYGLVYFNPTDPEVKRLAEPFLRDAILRNAEIRETVHGTNDRILSAGYHLQVEKSDAATFFFYNGVEGRKAVTWGKDGFLANGRLFTAETLADQLTLAPERFSPDVILRPVMQSYLFPVLAQYGGPSEIAYLAQLNPLFGKFDLPVPQHLPRPSATLVEKRFEKMLSEYGVPFEELTGDIEQVVNRVLEKSFPADLESRFQAASADISARFEQLVKESVEFDPTLKDFAKQTGGKLEFTLRTYQDKVFSSHKRKSKETRERIYRLHSALYPNRAPQDRSLNIGYFIAKYGFGVVSFLYRQMEVDETSHQLIFLSEMSD